MLKNFVIAGMLLFAPAVVAQEHDHSHAEGDGHNHGAATVPDSGIGLRGDLVYGSASAPVEVVEYGSFTCPHCAHFAAETFPRIKADFIDTGKIRFVFRNFVRDRYDMAVATISRCTVDPVVASNLTEEFFVKQEEWIRSNNPYDVMAAVAGAAGVETQAMGECISDESLQQHLIEMRNLGIETYKIDGLPTFIVNGVKTKGYSYEVLKEAIEAAR